MPPAPHGGRLVDRLVPEERREAAQREAARLARFELSPELARDVMGIATGILSPLEGFLARYDFETVLGEGRLADGLPWTIPIVLDVSEEDARGMGERVALSYRGDPFALLDVEDVYPWDRETMARRVFGTTDRRHPGVRKVEALKSRLVGGEVTVFRELASSSQKYALRPRETRVLYAAKGWRTVVGFQTRNVPHLGHEYVQKTALTFVDGIFINPVIGPKKEGDFRDEVILAAYEVLLRYYYLKERAVMGILETEMRYAGPREAIFHAILRKNFGCTHFIVGRDHAGVGDFYAPYAAQEIFDQFPDLGIVPLFFNAFFHCARCGGVANEKTCPHGAEERVNFSGTDLRNALRGNGRESEFDHVIRPEVARVIRGFPRPFVEAS